MITVIERQRDIQNHQLRREPREILHHVLKVLCRVCLIALGFHVLFDSVRDCFIILNDQNFIHHLFMFMVCGACIPAHAAPSAYALSSFSYIASMVFCSVSDIARP